MEKQDISFKAVVIAAVAAAVISTGAQLFMWWFISEPLPETLYRDTRLAAAIVMGEDIVEPAVLMLAPSVGMFLAASAIHFGLSLIYAAVYALIMQRVNIDGPLGLLTGGAFGIIIYANNLYGFTVIFPWFTIVRDWVTIGAHLVFGIVIAWCIQERG